ncbi:unnamed protein product, partial [Ixodes pacificus]
LGVFRDSLVPVPFVPGGKEVAGDPKGPRIKPFKCVTCFKRFASAESLRVHCYYMHRVVKLHCCLGCKRSFKKRYDLRKHWERSPLCQAFGDEDCPPQF